MRHPLVALLVVLLAARPSGPGPTSGPGRVSGYATVTGQSLSNLGLALVNLDTGSVHHTRTTSGGRFELSVAPGRYAVATDDGTGLVITRAPAAVEVATGVTTKVDVELQPIPVVSVRNADTKTRAALTVEPDPVGCLLEGEYPLLEATITPAQQVAGARLYFKTVLASGFYFVEMTPTGEGRFLGKLPAPKVEASPITLYVEATDASGAFVRSDKISARVVSRKEECPAGLAPSTPTGGVQVYSAATGSAVNPAGFAASGVALTTGILGLLLSGAAAAGLSATVTIFNPSPPPTPTPRPSPSPTVRPSPPIPTPTPTPLPTPTPVVPPPPPPATPFQ